MNIWKITWSESGSLARDIIMVAAQTVHAALKQGDKHSKTEYRKGWKITHIELIGQLEK